MKRKGTYYQFLLAVSTASFCIFLNLFGATTFDILGRIESIDKDNTIVLLFKSKPIEKTYYMMNMKTVYGTVEIVSVVYVRTGEYRYRAIAQCAPLTLCKTTLIDANFSIARRTWHF